jgi:hypothetical protein
MRERKVLRVYVDSKMETTVTEEGPEFKWQTSTAYPKTWTMTTTKTRGFNSYACAARWLAKRELQQRIVKEFNPEDRYGWQCALVKLFPSSDRSASSKEQSRQWIQARAQEILKEWNA